IIMDVTEREVGERLRREFTSNVSHELKTPLTSIYGVSDMLASGLVKPEDVGQFAGTIKEESSRLISLIDDIMQLSRLDENSVKKEKEDVDLYLVTQDVLGRLKRMAEQAGVSLQLEGSSTMVYGIDYIMDEIVYNLCENAIKYNRPGGMVTVFVGTELGTAVLRVTDTGIGIPKEDLDRVFERFYRVDKSHNRQIPGTGLGLSIVKHGVAYHNGSLSLESSEGVGTTITVKLPLPKR
ncbi:MAG: histidine kinase, partial [Firmicutes bacterium]|nr:histidine kinase [Bacillota bacterium]